MNHVRSTVLRLALVVLAASLVVHSGPAHPDPAHPVPDAADVNGAWPLDPEPTVVRGFAPPELRWESGHRGVDLAGRPGQVVRAALPGEIGFAGSIGGKPVVTVVHGARRTTYEPVEALVSRGDRVERGQPIGRLLTVAGHCFPSTCLHWGLREGDTYLDPLQLVGGGPVRLLPLWRDQPVGDGAAALTRHGWPPPTLPLVAWVSPLAALAAGITPGDVPVGRPGGGDRW